MTEQPRPTSSPRVVTLSEIEAIVSTDTFAILLIDALLNGFVEYSNGQFNSAPIQTLGAPPLAPFSCGSASSTATTTPGVITPDITTATDNYSAQTCVKSGYITNSPYYCIKVASGGLPLPTNSGNIQLYSQTTGQLQVLLCDEGLLTELRTAAAGAVAAKLLAPNLLNADDEDNDGDGRSNGCIGIVGTGIQARYQLRYLKYITTCRKVLIYGRTAVNVQTFITDMSQEGWNISSVSNVDDLLQCCTLIVTTTCAREPYLGIGWMGSTADLRRCTNQPRPLHITCIGSDSTGKQEVDNSLILHAQLLVCDSRLQTTERGEYEDVIKRGMIDVNKDVIEIGELAGRKELHRQRKQQVGKHECGSTSCTDTNNNGDNGEEDNRLTIFDSSGVAVQDCVIACMVYEALQQQS
jgi:ornithine cyclodeaminase